MVFVQIPVPWEKPEPRHLQQFFGMLDTFAGRKVWVHCAKNFRVSAFVYLYRRLRLGQGHEEALHPLRPFLRNWVWEHGHVGTRYLDCVDGQIKFDDGQKSRFADEPIFYVPLGEEAGGDAGPVVHEGALARFLRAQQNI